MPLSPSPPVPPPRRRRHRRRRRRCRHRRHRPARCRHRRHITAAAVADTTATVALFLAGAAVAATVAEAHRSPPPPLPEGYYTADWGFLLTDVVCVDPGGALDFALNAKEDFAMREPAPPLACAAPPLRPRRFCAMLPFPLRCPARCVAPCAVGAAVCAAPHARLQPSFACQGVARLQRGHRRLHAAQPTSSCSTSFLLDVSSRRPPARDERYGRAAGGRRHHGRRQIHAGTCSS